MSLKIALRKSFRLLVLVLALPASVHAASPFDWLQQKLLGQPFIKDDKLTIEKLLASAKAKVLRYARLEVGAGIEKKQDDFVAEVMAQAGVKK